MEANELRIGNLFIEKHCGETITVESISKERIGFSGEFYGKWQAEPIPITEEWLLRFGFDKGEEYYLNKNLDSKEGIFEKMCYDLQNKEFTINCNNYDGYCVEVEYIHQLQNLYFALTGEELKLNEK